MNRSFTKEEIQMATMKGIHVIKDVKIRTTTKNHYTPTSLARIKSGNIKYNGNSLLMGV